MASLPDAPSLINILRHRHMLSRSVGQAAAVKRLALGRRIPPASTTCARLTQLSERPVNQSSRKPPEQQSGIWSDCWLVSRELCWPIGLKNLAGFVRTLCAIETAGLQSVIATSSRYSARAPRAVERAVAMRAGRLGAVARTACTITDWQFPAPRSKHEMTTKREPARLKRVSYFRVFLFGQLYASLSM